MRTSFTIVGKVHDTVFPFARILIVHVANNLIDHLLRLFGRANWQTSYTDIHGSGGIIIAFGVIQETEIVVGGIAFHFVEGVFRLVGKQQGRTGVRQQFAVIKRTMTHQQQPSRFGVYVIRTIVEHLHQPAVSCSIRRTGGELIIDLLGVHDCPCDTLFRLMRFSKLSSDTLIPRIADDDIVDILESMQILVRYIANYSSTHPRATVGIDSYVLVNTIFLRACPLQLIISVRSGYARDSTEIRDVPNLRSAVGVGQMETYRSAFFVVLGRADRHETALHGEVAGRGELDIVQPS